VHNYVCILYAQKNYEGGWGEMLKKITILTISLLTLVCSVFAAELTLQWTMNTEPDVEEYKVFKRIGSTPNYDYDNPYATKRHIDCGVVEVGKCEVTMGVSDLNALHFVVRAYDDVHRASGNSNEVSYDPDTDTSFLTAVWQDATIYAHPVYFGTTDKDVTVDWSPHVDGIAYEYVLYDVFKKVNTSVTGEIAGTSVTFRLPKTGSYEMKVRARRSDLTWEPWVTIEGRYVGWPGGAGPIIFGIGGFKPL